MKILIMAGGSGERFWPLSTKKNPKQLLSLVSRKSMIMETVVRVLKLVKIDDIFVATNSIQVEGIKKELPNLPESNIIIEPLFRDTAAAIAYGSTVISQYEKNPTIAVLASDHLIEDEDEFIKALKKATIEAEQGYIVTLGINPTRPETGYGYIRINEKIIGQPVDAVRFLEKPDYETALEYYESSKYVWNSGMFIFQYDTIMNELNKFVPNHVETINNIKPLMVDFSGEELSQKAKPYFENFDKISIDYAVMEKSERIRCIPVDFGWNDVGGYNSLFDILEKDSDGNIAQDCRYFGIDSNNNLIISDNKDKVIGTMGISNQVIVDTKKATLIIDRKDTQRIKKLLKIVDDDVK